MESVRQRHLLTSWNERRQQVALEFAASAGGAVTRIDGSGGLNQTPPVFSVCLEF